MRMEDSMHKYMIFSWALLRTLFLDKFYYLISADLKEKYFCQNIKNLQTISENESWERKTSN